MAQWRASWPPASASSPWRGSPEAQRRYMDDHDLVLKPMVTWGSPMSKTPPYLSLCMYIYITRQLLSFPQWQGIPEAASAASTRRNDGQGSKAPKIANHILQGSIQINSSSFLPQGRGGFWGQVRCSGAMPQLNAHPPVIQAYICGWGYWDHYTRL